MHAGLNPLLVVIVLGPQNHLDAAVGLGAEHVVTVPGLFQRQMVGGEAGHAERVAAVADQGNEVIVEAVRARRAEIILTPAGQLVSRVAGLAPGLTSGILHLVQQLTLPAPAGRPARGTGDGIPGYELNPALARKAFDRLTALGRAAATRFNERPRPAPPSGS